MKDKNIDNQCFMREGQFLILSIKFSNHALAANLNVVLPFR